MLYEVSLSVLDLGNPAGAKLTLPDLLVMELPAILHGIDILVGMDVLLTMRFALDGPGRHFSLDF